ncbi:MAG: HD domain-containing protein [Candidatus Omnitrophica bacterium]|nr:HD domain-containing protein [Candidatus Omnitrophota bacterium]
MVNNQFFFGSFRSKITVALVLSLFLVAAISSLLLYQFSYRAQFEQFREHLKMVAQTAAFTVDPDLLMQVPLDRDGVKSSQYNTIAEKLSQIKKANPQILFIYTMDRTDKGVWQFIVDPEPRVQTKGESGATSYPGDKYDASRFPEMLKALSGPSADSKLMIDEWGATLSGYAPIRGKDGKTVAILGIDISAQNVYGTQRELLRRAILVLGAGMLISIALGLLVSKRATDPVKELEEATRHFGAGDLQYRVHIKGRDEIGRLGESFNKMAESLVASKEALRDYFYRIVQSLVRGLEAKDSYTSGHSDRVSEYSRALALEMGLSVKDADMLKEVAELHDIGKLGIDERVLNKVEKLTDEEWRTVKQHPVTGEEILGPVFLDKRMLSIVRSHHERYDGSGYPDGLKGGEIDMLAQIVSVADAYDAMTTTRAYRGPLTKQVAIEELKKHSGTQFNPLLVDAFLRVLGREGKDA